MSYGQKLLEFRAKNNLTQKQLADLFGVGIFMIYRYEKGINQPTSANKIKFENKMKELEEKRNV
jgi:transcriptional regulator with XRE-family HTH domain